MPSIVPPQQGRFRRLVGRWTGGSGTSEERRGDITLAALGITLGLTAAIFPWYVFFNQDQFGIRAMRFEGNGEGGPAGRMPADLPFPTELVERPTERGLIPLLEVDRFSTGNVRTDDNPTGSVPVAQQPFPGAEKPAARFEIVHIENGRVMVADDGGIWLARVGSRLPDTSKIASIERRDGKLVVVTDGGQVIVPTN
ncbi:MAG: hypothetical protein KF849_11790 [Rhizobiaceae bacterium]|nr:hypothetical protein [Rhizobiaceae bacterium]